MMLPVCVGLSMSLYTFLYTQHFNTACMFASTRCPLHGRVTFWHLDGLLFLSISTRSAGILCRKLLERDCRVLSREGEKNNNKRTPLPPYRYVGFLQAARWFVVPEGRHGDLKLANAEYDEPRAK
ncbi:hypothetical protein, unlikely [Trypanosoma brucei gambiense DAL972]|uniref:Uncharacterized protein n=1 Tax=Trypanosoma brucei gambiense (strain MHOM/CI/86/DAL972) TaxID=679716 RepID=C9ZNG8_TRYB9|nr:hypothetical protein, unlikely [Trypanosoma brucei gambiense DAL972]CBH10946.1 hypothetical protein, unlikely [Trypanosoma brucei gambiense DAL972]|eukprot:XP_011773233.1 hypothetical protein, unlikely [Trypanosoma brucei gambiense DAL972]